MSIVDEVYKLVLEVVPEVADDQCAKADIRLIGVVPSFDSMAIAALVTRIEEYFGTDVEDEDLRAEVFESVGTIALYVECSLGQ